MRSLALVCSWVSRAFEYHTAVYVYIYIHCLCNMYHTKHAFCLGSSCSLRLCLQGFPLHPTIFEKFGREKLCSYHTVLQPNRNPRTVGQQAGNSMNLAVLQLTQLHGYMCLVPRKVPTLLSMVRVFSTRSREERRRHRKRLRSKTPARNAAWALVGGGIAPSMTTS